MKNLKRKTNKSVWGNYHTEVNIEDTYRFQRIVEIINELPNISSALELAANQGKFSSYLLKNTKIDTIIASDYDEVAVDIMYKNTKGILGFQSLLFDFVRPDGRGCDTPLDHRVKSDVLIALAVTHHLLLSQNVKIEYLIERFKNLTQNYLIVEFMPLGFGEGISTPEYYTLDWFRDNLDSLFTIISEEELCLNRYLFVAKLKGCCDEST